MGFVNTLHVSVCISSGVMVDKNWIFPKSPLSARWALFLPLGIEMLPSEASASLGRQMVSRTYEFGLGPLSVFFLARLAVDLKMVGRANLLLLTLGPTPDPDGDVDVVPWPCRAIARWYGV